MRDIAESSNIAKSRGLSLQGTLFGCVLALVSVISVKIGRFEAGLGLVPLIAIFLWPRGSSKGLSAVGIFLTGFMVDVLGAGPIGLSAMMYLAFYGVLQPDYRGRNLKFRDLWLRFTGWVLLAAGFMLLIGALFISGRTALSPLLWQVLAACLAFPALYLVRQILRQLVVDPNEPGYAP